ncbi:hypothetical protein C4J81_03135 [Deltaproteobacteria bacterium Smac51]|nr:hypothetical protein C4J81_03135 [Deltaproteobacteria bacterium Smac51]
MRALSSREKGFLFTFLCSVWAMLFSLSFVQKEDPIYAGDISRSHDATVKLIRALDESFLTFLNTIRSSLSSSYNVIADLPPTLLELLTGSTSRGHFIMALVVCYLTPLCFLLPRYSWKFFGDSEEKPLPLMLCLILWSFLCLSFWPILLGGYTDLSSLIPLLIALGLAVDTDFSSAYQRRRMIILGLCLYLAFMFRRWYIFAIGSVYLTCLIVSLGALNRDNAREKLTIIVKNLVTAGLTTLLLIMIFQFPVFRGMVFNRYKDKYSAFQGPLSNSLLGIYSTVGPVILLTAAAALLTNFVRRRKVRASLFILICPLIFFAAVTRLQALDMHHTLGVNIYIWLAAFGGIINLYLALPKAGLKAILCLAVTAYMIIGFQGAFSTRTAEEKSPLLPGAIIKPVKHPNFAGLNELMLDLKELADNSSTKIFLAGSSNILNEHMVRNNIPSLRQHILDNKGIDKRDGIVVFQLMAAKYVVTVDPVRAVVKEDEQTTVIVPVDKLMKGEGIGRAYTKLEKTYDLGNGVTAHIYKKERAFTLAEVRDYIDSFPAGHERWTNPVSQTDELLMTAWELVSDGVERQPFDRENSRGDYVIKSGHDPATSVTLNLEGFERIKFSLTISAWKKVCGGHAFITAGVPGREAEKADLNAGETLVYDMELGNPPQLVLSAEGNGGTACDRVFFRILESE